MDMTYMHMYCNILSIDKKQNTIFVPRLNFIFR